MSRSKELITAGATLACALGIGFAMQSLDGAERTYSPAAVQNVDTISPAIGLAPLEKSEISQIIDGQDAELTSAQSMEPSSVVQAVLPAVNESSEIITAAQTDSCEIFTSASATPDALIGLDIVAVCRPGELVTIHHSGMMFREQLGDDGQISLTVPALTSNAVLIVAFEDGEGDVAQVAVPNLSDFKRVVLQWKTGLGFELHAREFGADYGSDGHVWHQSPPGVDRLGQFHRLGADVGTAPIFADVYSFPAVSSARNGHVDLTVEASVTSSNCGREIEAQTLELDSGGVLKTQNISLSVPDCETIGDYLVLNNILENLKVAQR